MDFRWHGRGLTLTRALLDAGVGGIVAPLPAKGGQLWGERGGRRLIVLPWVDAPVGLDTDLTWDHWVAFGRLLTALHATPLAALPDLPPSDWQHCWQPVRSPRSTGVSTGRSTRAEGTSAEQDELVAAVLHEEGLLREVVDRLLAGADQLDAAGVWTGHASGVPCHADPHAGNTLAADDGSVWLLLRLVWSGRSRSSAERPCATSLLARLGPYP